MSAISPAIRVEEPSESGRVNVRAAVMRLMFRRTLWRGVAVLTFGAACAIAALCLLGALDYLRPLSRVVRIIAVAPVWCALLFIFARSLSQILRRPALLSAAREIERATGSRDNLLVTFSEQLESATLADNAPYMLARLSGQASERLAAVDERLVAPASNAQRGALTLVLMMLLLLGLRVLFPFAFALETRRILRLAPDAQVAPSSGSQLAGTGADGTGATAAIEELSVRVRPPAYTGMGVEDAPGDAPVRALVGSEIEVRLRARGGAVAGADISFNGASTAMRALGEGGFSTSFVASASGAFEVRLLTNDGLAPAAVVRAVETYADAPPEAHIIEPQSDQLLRTVPAEPINVRLLARDDLGLAGIAMKYIKSHGEGDAAKFINGEVSIGTIERPSPREWRGTASLDLQRLGMQPGDTLVFWLEARDRNPAANNTGGRSASIAIAIRAPEAARLNLSDLLPNEIGRFLLSERQIIIKTEKLQQERQRLAQDEVLSRAHDIAADQRDFKNSFNDYIKIEGAGEDEPAGASADKANVEERARSAEDERTATHFHGIPEPPEGAPASVREMIYAIRAMWDAEESLSLADTTQALVHEREALMRLKRAQTAVRYIPPIVAQSKPVDLKRRYAGELAEIKTRLEKLARRPQSKESAVLLAALSETYAALEDLQGTLGLPDGARASASVRARERSRQAADRLINVGGDHAVTIAEAAGQLRIVEAELARMETSGTTEAYASRLSKPLALLTQAASNLFAIVEANTRATSSETGTLLPADDGRAADYFRRLSGVGPR